jgi:TonB family protein
MLSCQPERCFKLLLAASTCLVFSVAGVRAQSLDYILSVDDKVNLETLAQHTANRIDHANRGQPHETVLVVDLVRGSLGTSSRLGSLLADRFAESLASATRASKILDRKLLATYLTDNWSTLEDLRTNKVCLYIGRSLGATGVVLGKIYEENGYIAVKIHLSGFGPSDEQTDGFDSADELARLRETESLRSLLFAHGPDYSRQPDKAPDQPGLLRAGVNGVTMPSCTHCPDPEYSDAARAAEVQGRVVLSVVVTSEGKAGAIQVLVPGPLGLTKQAIRTVEGWNFKPAEKDGQPVSVAMPIEITFRLSLKE